MPKVTVVTPSFNQAPFLRRTIESVLSQDVDLEYFILDGCSTDGSVEILDSYASRANIIVEKDHGQADALRKGFARATGDILAWLNSDDMYLPGTLAKVVQAFERGEEFTYGDVLIVDAEDKVLRRRVTIPIGFNDLYYGMYIIPQESTFFSRRIYQACGGINPGYHFAMDYDLWLRMAVIREPARLDGFLSCFRYHAGQKSEKVELYVEELQKARSALQGAPPLSRARTLERRLSLACRKFYANAREAGVRRTLEEIRNKKLGRLP
jgi:glycosyltransferase involved in cell wall biosynthesis